MKKEVIFIIILLILGLIYRLFLSSLAYGEIYWDVATYHNFATSILAGGLPTDCCNKNVGYSIFLALVYLVFGINNLIATRRVQVVVDLLTSIFIYLTAKNIFNKNASRISFVLYLANPLTASYAGLRLPEVVSVFYISFVLFISSLPTFKINKILWFFWGLVMGLIVFTRTQYLHFSLLMMFTLVIFYFRKINRIGFILISLIGFMFASSYTLASNYIVYKKISVVAPYMSRYGGFYMNFYNTSRYPELFVQEPVLDPQYQKINQELILTPLSDRPALDEKFKLSFLSKLKNEWPVFLKIVLSNIIWLWDKDHLYAYQDPFYPGDSLFIRLINLIWIFLFFTGIIFFTIKYKLKTFLNPVAVTSIALYGYITFIFSLVSNESRHTVFFYCVIFLWAGYSIDLILRRLSNLTNKK